MEAEKEKVLVAISVVITFVSKHILIIMNIILKPLYNNIMYYDKQWNS